MKATRLSAAMEVRMGKVLSHGRSETAFHRHIVRGHVDFYQLQVV